ncbi:MAG TPA: LLM class F420-dependent oxidoreductase [Conexibacter sp.]
MKRIGITVPFDGLSLLEHREPLARLCEAGYGEVSTGEVNALDGVTPLILFSAWQPQLTLSVGIVSAFTRGPGVLAMTAAAMAEAAPGKARFGIGAGSDRVVEGWNGIPFAKPYSRVANTLRFLRGVLATGRAERGAEELGSKGFRLTRLPEVPPQLLIAALGPKMQQLAKAEADGVILNFLSPGDVRLIADHTAGTARELDAPLEVEARVFVIPGSDSAAELAARRHIAAYLTVPVYTEFQRWLGRGAQIEPLLEAWNGGDRKRAVELVPDELVSDLFVMGTPAECAAGVARYLDAGVDIATIAFLPPFGRELSAREQVDFLCAMAESV